MAHFAQLDENNVVTQVIVVRNEDTTDTDGIEKEHIGIAFCQSLFGNITKWVKTSYNGNIRKNYAGIGYAYDADRDAFIPPQPYDSWVLDETVCRWVAPTPMPTDGQVYQWNEETTSWENVNE